MSIDVLTRAPVQLLRLRWAGLAGSRLRLSAHPESRGALLSLAARPLDLTDSLALTSAREDNFSSGLGLMNSVSPDRTKRA